MTSTQGYFDGNVFVPLEKSNFAKDDVALILKSNSSVLERFFGILDDESADAARRALADCRSIKNGDWQFA